MDSRAIKAGELFVAIRGNRLDGHSFINQAVGRGAKAVLFSDKCKTSGGFAKQASMIKVKDSRASLAALAYDYRRRFKIPVIAVTGSNGKTTTKEMISAILSKRYNVLRNPGTENNLIGVAKTLFKLQKRHDLIVMEIGTNHFGEIDRLAWMLRPKLAVITNIAPAHLEFFKSLKGVLKAKLELITHLGKNSKMIINKDDRLLGAVDGLDFKTIAFGIKQIADFHGEIISQTKTGTSFLLNQKQRIVLKVLGRHNVYNALASIACARCMQMPMQAIKEALATFQAPPMRMQLQQINNIKFINDCYNANPESLAYALDFLNSLPSRGKKIVISGDMLELGSRAPKLHKDSGKRLAKDSVDVLITVGKLARHIALGARLAGMDRAAIHSFDNRQQVLKLLRKIISSGDIVLIKGSRAMQMERILGCFMNSSIH